MDRYYLSCIKRLDRKISGLEKTREGVCLEIDGLKFFAPREPETVNVPVWKNTSRMENHGSFQYILSEQFVNRIYEKHYKIRKGDTVIDVGANIGTFTVMAARKAGDSGRVVAIEPEKKNLKFLRKNIRANGLENVIIVPKGAWSSKTRKKLFLKGLGEHSLLRRTGKSAYVKMDRLDDILESLGIRNVDFIKMDVEGAESEVLKGADRTLGGKMSMAVCGYHTIDGKPTHREIISILKGKGFSVSFSWKRARKFSYRNEQEGIIYARK